MTKEQILSLSREQIADLVLNHPEKLKQIPINVIREVGVDNHRRMVEWAVDAWRNRPDLFDEIAVTLMTLPQGKTDVRHLVDILVKIGMSEVIQIADMQDHAKP